MKKLLCVAASALLLLSACQESTASSKKPTIVSGRKASSSADLPADVSGGDSSQPERVRLEDDALQQMVDDFTAPAFTLTVDCEQTRENAALLVKTDAELGSLLADLFSQNEFEPDMEKPEESNLIGAPLLTMEARNAKMYSRVNLYEFDKESAYQPGKALMVLENSDGATRRYLYDGAVYQQAKKEIESRIYGVPVAFSGACVPMRSKFDLSKIKKDSGLTPGEFLQFGTGILWRFVPADKLQGKNSTVELLNAETGKSYYSFSTSEPVLRMEKYTAEAGYNYRLVMPSKIWYKNTADSTQRKEWSLPFGVSLFTASAELTGGYDLRYGKLAYAAGDGIHLSNETGGNDRLLLSHGALDGVMAGESGGSWYFNDPRLLLDGTKLATSIVSAGTGQKRMGFALTDLETSETSYFTGMTAPHAYAVDYPGDSAIAVHSGDSVTLIDAKTGESGAISLEGPEGTSYFTSDYETFLVGERPPVLTEGESGVTTVYSCTVESIHNRQNKLLTAKGDSYYPVAATESYLIGYLEDSGGVRYTATPYREVPAYSAPAVSRPQNSSSSSSNSASSSSDSSETSSRSSAAEIPPPDVSSRRQTSSSSEGEPFIIPSPSLIPN